MSEISDLVLSHQQVDTSQSTPALQHKLVLVPIDGHREQGLHQPLGEDAGVSRPQRGPPEVAVEVYSEPLDMAQDGQEHWP